MVRKFYRRFKRKYRGAIGQRSARLAYRTASGKMAVARLMRYKNPTHYFKRVCNGSSIAGWNQLAGSGYVTINQNTNDDVVISMTDQANNNYAYIGLSFRINDLPNASEFLTLFDRYQISGVLIKIFPMNPFSITPGASTQVNGNGGIGGFLHSVTDYDDNTAFTASNTGVNDMRQYESYKCQNLTAGRGCFKYFIRPRLAVSAYQGGVFNAYANMRNLWIDCNSGNTEYYGKKFIFEISTPNITSSPQYYCFKMELTYYIKLKDLR